MAHGGKREGAGRKPGQVSTAKRLLSEMAKEHADMALKVLSAIAQDGEASPGARVTAATAILDRAYGKPFAAEPEPDDDADPVVWSISVRAAKGQVRVTKPERAASDIPEGS